MGQTATGQASNLCLLLSAEIKARIPPFCKPISRALPTYATLGRKVVLLLVAMGYLVLVIHIVPMAHNILVQPHSTQSPGYSLIICKYFGSP